MSKIYLARHGQDEDNFNGILNGHRNTKLTNIGIQQANLLAQKIKKSNLNIKKIFSSPLQRAYETAEIVSYSLNLPKPEKIKFLIERDFGIMTGKLVKDIESLCYPNILKADPITYFISAEGAETFPQLIERAKKLITWLKENNQNDGILLVSHGDIGKMIYAAFYNLDWNDVLIQFHFGNSEVLLLSEDSKPDERHLHKIEQFNQ